VHKRLQEVASRRALAAAGADAEARAGGGGCSGGGRRNSLTSYQFAGAAPRGRRSRRRSSFVDRSSDGWHAGGAGGGDTGGRSGGTLELQTLSSATPSKDDGGVGICVGEVGRCAGAGGADSEAVASRQQLAVSLLPVERFDGPILRATSAAAACAAQLLALVREEEGRSKSGATPAARGRRAVAAAFLRETPLRVDSGLFAATLPAASWKRDLYADRLSGSGWRRRIHADGQGDDLGDGGGYSSNLARAPSECENSDGKAHEIMRRWHGSESDDMTHVIAAAVEPCCGRPGPLGPR
jgi:hypothetical protein